LLESKVEGGSGSAEEIQELQHIHECAATKRGADRALYAEHTIRQVLYTMIDVIESEPEAGKEVQLYQASAQAALNERLQKQPARQQKLLQTVLALARAGDPAAAAAQAALNELLEKGHKRSVTQNTEPATSSQDDRRCGSSNQQ
jgi:hypothetical protein